MAMEPSWQEINDVFEAALDLPEADREGYIARACADDKTLRAEVEALLQAALDAENFLEVPAFSDAWQSGSTPRVGPYRVLREIGRGGMGTVYLAERDDGTFKQRVAIKVLRGDSESVGLLRRFHAERQILAKLDHPNLARLLDGGNTATQRPYFVMEYVDGEPIDIYCQTHRLDLRQRIELFRRVCAAVQYAHQNLIVHRDVKPSNILVNAEGIPKLLDFGIAKLLSNNLGIEGLERTETWHRALTPQYASPEQVRGELITTASDIYSLGVLLYKLLAGVAPYALDRRTPGEVEQLVCVEEPTRPSLAVARLAGEVDAKQGARASSEMRQLHRRLAGDLDHIVMKALRKEPEQRFASVEQFSEDLRRYLVALPVLARQGNLLYRGGRFLRRYRLAVGIAAAFLMLLVGFAVTTAFQSQRIAQQRDQAQQERAEAQRERQRAEQVSNFLVDLFELSDPEKALGQTVSARQLLDQGAARVDRELQDQPRLRADLKATMGRVFHGLGLYDESEAQFRDVLDLRREARDAEPLETARTLFDLAESLARQGEHEPAEAACREALDLRRERFEGDHPEIARSLNQLGSVRMLAGDYPSADSFLREALAMRERLGLEDEEIIASLHPLASNILHQGGFEEAEEIYRRALELARRTHGDRAYKVASIANDLAMALGRMQRLDEAGEQLRTALDIYTHTLPPDHPYIAEAQGNLAGILVEAGRYEEAEAFALRSLELDRKIHGDGYYGTASPLLLLGRIHFFTGRLDEAEAYCRESWEVIQVQLGDQHPHGAHPLVWLGRIELARDRPIRAEPHFKQAVSIWRNVLPLDHPFLAKAEGGWGAALARQGRTDEGRGKLAESLRVLEAVEGPNAEFTRWVGRHLADLPDGG